MKIFINENFTVVDDDGMQFILTRRTNSRDKKGEIIYKTCGYYKDLSSAVAKCARLIMNEGEDCILSEYIKRLEQIVEELKRLVNL